MLIVLIFCKLEALGDDIKIRRTYLFDSQVQSIMCFKGGLSFSMLGEFKVGSAKFLFPIDLGLVLKTK